MKIKEAFRKNFNELKPLYGENEAGSIMDLLFEHLGYPGNYRLIHNDSVIAPSDIRQLEAFKIDLLNHKPVQYILGYSWFLDMKFRVNPKVLIPRQETEELVYHIVNENQVKNLKILDIGTGSGCIAVSLSLKMNNPLIYALDNNKEAIEVANSNAKEFKANVSFIKDDILNPDFVKYPQFDILVSNPPYVTASEKKDLNLNVLHYEPEKALFVSDEDPLIFYRNILDFSDKKLSENGKLYLEINERFGNEMKDLLKDHGFVNIKIIQDIHGKDRFAIGVKQEQYI